MRGTHLGESDGSLDRAAVPVEGVSGWKTVGSSTSSSIPSSTSSSDWMAAASSGMSGSKLTSSSTFPVCLYRNSTPMSSPVTRQKDRKQRICKMLLFLTVLMSE